MGLIIVVGKSYILAQVDFRWGIWQIKIPRLVWQASSRWYLTGTLGDQIVLYNYQIVAFMRPAFMDRGEGNVMFSVPMK